LLNEPLWLPVEQAIRANQDEVAATAEAHAILDMAKLESAMSRPQNHCVYDGEHDVLRLAVILALAAPVRNPRLPMWNEYWLRPS